MSPLPDVTEALSDIGDEVALILISKSISGYRATELLDDPVTIFGVLQPLDAEELLLRPENQRQWKIWHFWSTEDVVLDAIVEDPDGKRFRVLAKQDWGSFKEYDLKEGPVS